MGMKKPIKLFLILAFTLIAFAVANIFLALHMQSIEKPSKLREIYEDRIDESCNVDAEKLPQSFYLPSK